MRKTCGLLGLFFINISSAFALTFEVLGKNEQILFRTAQDVRLEKSLGQITVDILDASRVPYDGGEYGITTLMGLGSDIKTISPAEIKAYGWCFSIDGHVPETMADETFLTNSDALLRWYYAYAHYKDGQWIAQCVQAADEGL